MKKIMSVAAIAFAFSCLFMGCSNEKKVAAEVMSYDGLSAAVNSAESADVSAEAAALNASSSIEDIANVVNAAEADFNANK